MPSHLTNFTPPSPASLGDTYQYNNNQTYYYNGTEWVVSYDTNTIPNTSVTTTGNQTITGVKTFSNNLVADGGVTGNITGDVTGTVLTAAQPNITSTGALTVPSGTVTGDLAVNGGDITTTAATATVFNTNATTLNVGGAATTVALGAAAGTVNIGKLSMNAGYGSIAPVYGCRAWANASNVPVSGTYSRLGNTVIVSITNHGIETGFVVTLNFTSGGAASGSYTATKLSSTQYTITTAASGTIHPSSNVTQTCFLRAGGNIARVEVASSKVIFVFNTAMPDIYYATMVSTDSASSAFLICNGSTGGGVPGGGLTQQTTTQFQIQPINGSFNAAVSNHIHVAVFR